MLVGYDYVCKVGILTFLFLQLDLVVCELTGELINQLYKEYKRAVENEDNLAFTRRLLKQNKEYKIHVEKLKEVNGFKRHNLYIEETIKSHIDKKPIIYINNPVESGFPNAYLNLDEFKEILRVRGDATKTTKSKISQPVLRSNSSDYVQKEFKNNKRGDRVKIKMSALRNNHTSIDKTTSHYKNTASRMKKRKYIVTTIKKNNREKILTTKKRFLNVTHKTNKFYYSNSAMNASNKIINVVSKLPVSSNIKGENLNRTLDKIETINEKNISLGNITEGTTLESVVFNNNKSEVFNTTEDLDDTASHSNENDQLIPSRTSTTVTTTKITRRTLGRPRVFIGR